MARLLHRHPNWSSEGSLAFREYDLQQEAQKRIGFSTLETRASATFPNHSSGDVARHCALLASGCLPCLPLPSHGSQDAQCANLELLPGAANIEYVSGVKLVHTCIRPITKQAQR